MKIARYISTLAALLLLVSGTMAAPKQPNVIMILIDDMGWADSSTYGSIYYQTPNLTRLAEEGMLFTDAYAASPLCSPTRASIMSGQYPARLRMTLAVTPSDVPEPKALPPEGNTYCGKVESKNHLPLEVFTLAEALKKAGYVTGHIGKWHLSPSNPGWKSGDATFNAEHQGFDYVIGGDHLPGPPDYYSPYQNRIKNLAPGPMGEYLNERLAEESIKWISSVEKSGKPFYLNFWHYAVHGPFIPKTDLLPNYNKLRDPDADQRCPEMATMLESMDASIGILLDWLDQPENLQLKQNTVIILTSDNGGVIHKEVNGNTVTSNRPLRGGKANTYEGGVRVPWIIRWPGRVEAGTICRIPVQTLDIYPTVLELASCKRRDGQSVDGQSIVPLLTGEPMSHQPIFTDFPHLFGVLCAPSSSVRVGDYKLIRYHHAGIDATSHAYELFDLKRDIYESINLANYMPEKVQQLDHLIEGHLIDTDALVPIRNEAYTGNPRTSRTNHAKVPGRPLQLHLKQTKIRVIAAGNRRMQLFDQNNNPRKTNALVMEGSLWVRVENQLDGSVLVQWDVPPQNGIAKVLFGWRGGTTAMEINDWTYSPSELTLGPSVESVTFSSKEVD